MGVSHRIDQSIRNGESLQARILSVAGGVLMRIRSVGFFSQSDSREESYKEVGKIFR